MITAAAAVSAAAAFVLCTFLPVLQNADRYLSDLLYQDPSDTGDRIVLVQIDETAIDLLGPYAEWGRGVVASAVEILNDDPENAPAVIGLDVLYTGESDPELDAYLAEVCAAGNVVVASAAEFGTSVKDGKLDEFSVLRYEEPYDALKEAAQTGHINAMLDGDGILRHSLLELTAPDGRVIRSMPWKLAEAYAKAHAGTAEYEGQKGPAAEAGILREPPTDRRGFWYLPYSGKPGAYSTPVSVADIFTGTFPPEFFAGKIVLIGPYAVGLQDSYFTAADHAEAMYGVEVQANAINAILNGDYKTELPGGPQRLFLFLLILPAFFCFSELKFRWSTLIWALLSGGWVLLCAGLYRAGYVLHPLWIPLFLTLLYIACVAYNYLRAAADRRKIQSTFSRYVDPEIITDLMKEDSDSLELGGKLTRVAVLFVDIRGFTSMSEVLSAEEVVEILNRYLTLTSECIFKNHGTLDKFVGDCTMAFWGAPLPQEDYCMNAVRCAFDMVEGSKALSEELLNRFGRTVSFGIGVNVGDAVIGNIGSPKRMDYTAIGDTVNTASRLESNAPAGTIYISRAVADELEGRIECTSLGDSIKLKGKKEGFEVLKVEKILDR